MIMTNTISIPDSARLRYRLMGENDGDLLFELDQDPEVMRYLSDGKPTSREEIDEYFLPRIARFTNPATGCGVWEIADKQSGEYLGWILVRHYGFETHYHAPENIELGWRLKRSYWGLGITTEAAAAIIDVLRSNPAIAIFSAQADPDNLGSIGVMKNLRMEYVDDRIHHTPKQEYPVVYYEMLARE
jgi:RimJ/RimL family protein N-acetyltransferase